MTFDLEAMRRDAAAGTPGPWSAGTWGGDSWPERRWSVGAPVPSGQQAVCISPRYADPEDLTDARRIARVPAMEAKIERLTAALAAAEQRAERAEAGRVNLYEAGFSRACEEVAAAAPDLINQLCLAALVGGFVVLERRLADAQAAALEPRP